MFLLLGEVAGGAVWLDAASSYTLQLGGTDDGVSWSGGAADYSL